MSPSNKQPAAAARASGRETATTNQAEPTVEVSFDADPASYRHWHLELDGEIAWPSKAASSLATS